VKRAFRRVLARGRGALAGGGGASAPAPPFLPEPGPADVPACYRLLLGRDPDPGDRTALSTAIAAGWPLETLVRCVLCSREFRARRWPEILQAGAAAGGGAGGPAATAADVAACYRFVLGRGPDPEGWETYLRAVRDGVGRDALLRGFLLSPEFRQRPLARALLTPSARPVAMKLGFPFAVYDTDDAIGAEFRRAGEFEPHVTAQFLARVRPGQAVLDVGANAGYFTVLAGRAVGAAGTVYAFEPYAANVALVHANVRLNALTNVRVFPFALAERWDCFSAYAVDTNAGLLAYDGDALALPARDVVFSARLDDLLAAAPRVDVIKIDVEGFEHRALAGGAGIIARHRPLIFTELLPEALRMASGVSPEEYLAFLAGFGYAISVIREDGTLLDCGTDAARVLAAIGGRGGHADLLAVPAPG
jgi:FkbM family methyltransferase